ncbi:helix-turn-helix domain-containing protein [Nocardia sp. CA-107356]|uniref:helix-turn-helix domain-containing protein n=1 Tax=Nocardia sp. CA-107356 TaxID=3239972 RepID=UPI003D8B8DD8
MIVYGWTGVESKALREAMNLTIEQFAQKVQVAARTVEGWEIQGAKATLRPSSRRLLDQTLTDAPKCVAARFERALGAHPDSPDELDPRPPRTVTLANDTLRQLSPATLGADEADHVWVPARTAAGEVVLVSLPRRTVVTGIGVGALAAAVGVKPPQSRVDERLISSIEIVLDSAKRQDDALGAAAVVGTVLAQASLVDSVIGDCPARLRSRLISLYADLCRFAGWLHFDLGDFASASRLYEKARIAAHEAEDLNMGVFVLSHMCHLAVWQGQNRVAVDYAAAAMHWAVQSDDHLLRADTAEMAARAYAGMGAKRACLAALEINAAMTHVPDHDRTESLAYFYSPTLSAAAHSHCYLQLGDARKAEESAKESMALTDSSFIRDHTFSMLDLGRAQVALGNIDEAVANLGRAAVHASANRSARLAKSLRQVRSSLNNWADAAEVKELDNLLTDYKLSSMTE